MITKVLHGFTDALPLVISGELARLLDKSFISEMSALLVFEEIHGRVAFAVDGDEFVN
jgi:hypothetical protein